MARMKVRGWKRRRKQPIITNINLQSEKNLRKMPFRFFKIILPAILDQHRLRVPEEFTKNFSTELSTVATLTIPTGLSWKIALSTIESKLYLTQGWVDFMMDNDIRYGYFLEFEYHGNNHFEVHIFNLTCCEIDYPLEYEIHHLEQKKSQNEDLVKVIKEKVEVDQDEGDEKICDILKSKRKNPSFTKTLRNYNLSSAAYFHIPTSYTNKYLKQNSFKFVKLQVGNEGKVRSVGCYRYKGRVRFTTGWRAFARDNNLDAGESYTFVLVAKKRKYVTFKVIKE